MRQREDASSLWNFPGSLYVNAHHKSQDHIQIWSLQDAKLSKILKRVFEGLSRRLWFGLWSQCFRVLREVRETSKGLTWYALQEEIHTGGTERAPYVSTDASASQSSQPQPASPFLPLFLLHKQNPKNPLLQLMLPLGLLKQSELAGQIRIPSDNFFTLIPSEHHIKLFIVIPTLKPSSQGCQERRKNPGLKWRNRK